MTRKPRPHPVWVPAVMAGLLAAMIASSAHAVINPRFTPVDLVRTSKQIVTLRVSAPKEKMLVAEVADAFGAGKTASAVLVLQASGDESSNDVPAGAMQIGIRWFAVFRERGKWRLGQDQQDLFAVWAGSAEKLIEGTRYIIADPAADFPVRSDITWESDLHLGKLPGEARAANQWLLPHRCQLNIVKKVNDL